MAVTANDLVRKVRSLSGDWGKLTTTLAAALTDATTTVTLTNMSDTLTEEWILEVGLERMRVVNVGADLTVERGAEGSTAAEHALGTLCILEPRFPNENLLDKLNLAARMLAVYEPLVAVSAEGDYVYDSTIEEYDAPTGAVSVIKVDMEKPTVGLYRPFYGYTVLDEYDPPVIRIPYQSNLAGKNFRVVYGSVYPELAWDTDTTIPVKWHDFLVEYALGLALEDEEVENAALKVQTGNASFRPGYAQQVARTLQARALGHLEVLRPATRIIRRPDQRQYRL